MSFLGVLDGLALPQRVRDQDRTIGAHVVAVLVVLDHISTQRFRHLETPLHADSRPAGERKRLFFWLLWRAPARFVATARVAIAIVKKGVAVRCVRGSPAHKNRGPPCRKVASWRRGDRKVEICGRNASFKPWGSQLARSQARIDPVTRPWPAAGPRRRTRGWVGPQHAGESCELNHVGRESRERLGVSFRAGTGVVGAVENNAASYEPRWPHAEPWTALRRGPASGRSGARRRKPSPQPNRGCRS